ncbi:MAG: hypothetical protein LCH63_04250 [Candidatus Melainabacteria bacterium]|jgi:N-acetylglutamate synthase-like GNAT family acetyltransferase|uniref:Uncharacterized protein n=1 Tax=Candidatus Obscuribacter phosphatis TaxID=1906157 RepID=A0A8J7P7W9_9BACT|nr:hypothetical protein [Candidatus Obscuribacter phosphatis]MCA0313037.1 hypothetical protein [Candidatus Melainabacteria bacterium]OPZ83185.1 MAG: hypothetical protein BWY75_03131 [bacterium ADurb.Bin425]
MSDQIRLANRQDEKEIRELTESLYQASGQTFSLEEQDNDLRNIEGKYIGPGGIFLVYELDGKLSGYLAAACDNENETIEIKRNGFAPACVSPSPAEIYGRMLAVVRNHAYQMDIKSVLIDDNNAKVFQKEFQ